jgi:hypothetical protein
MNSLVDELVDETKYEDPVAIHKLFPIPACFPFCNHASILLPIMTTATISNSDKNESFFLYGVQNTGFEEVDKPIIASDDEVIVQIRKTG